MKIFISVISHGHCSLIKELGCLGKLLSKFTVIVKSNKDGDDFSDWLHSKNFHWIDDQYGCGFGHNNNVVFEFCRKELAMSDEDIFIVYNPDVVIENNELDLLATKMNADGVKLAAINLFKDKDYRVYDNSIRNYPSLESFLYSFLGLGNKTTLNKDKIYHPCKVDWAAGSFLAFKAEHYTKLSGFDTDYFMYCEDIDICLRSRILGHSVYYYPSVKALHLAKHANRSLFSKHFLWHLTSAIRFLIKKHKVSRPRFD
ncbi:N-acetylglucosaminyl-diphospho-decaprenol L-rhamnosyltransferase WbbL [Vibrio owensii]